MNDVASAQHLQAWVHGVGAWTPTLPDWPALRGWLQGQDTALSDPAHKPHPAMLSASERRRAPRSVLAAIEAASQAVDMADLDARQVPSLFACTHGDADILDYTCTTLADNPMDLSPTRFHNSVHNAAAGYWTMATGCHASSSALTAFDFTFAAALLEAACMVHVERTPVLLVAHDIPGCGPLAEVLASRQLFACALLLAPESGKTALARIDIQPTRHQPQPVPAGRAGQLAAANVSARGAALLDLLARDQAGAVRLQAAPQLDLDIHLTLPA